MFVRCFEMALIALLLTLSLPFLALHSLLARRRGNNLGRMDFFKLPITGEFGFERAVEAYEELIDTTLAQRRV